MTQSAFQGRVAGFVVSPGLCTGLALRLAIAGHGSGWNLPEPNQSG
ncbi:hypothetical protein [Roseibium album]|nr:hypothetical protein [Roseibium album]